MFRHSGRWGAPLLVPALAIALVACGGAETLSSVSLSPSSSPVASARSASNTPASPKPSAAATAMNASIYFETGGKLVAEHTTVDSTDPLRQALQTLLKGPAQPGHFTEIPAGTKLLDVSLASGTASVSLSPEFFTSGGSTAAEVRVGQVVYTATGFPTVRSVRLLKQGQPATLGEGLNVSQPLTRDTLRGVAVA